MFIEKFLFQRPNALFIDGDPAAGAPAGSAPAAPPGWQPAAPAAPPSYAAPAPTGAPQSLPGMGIDPKFAEVFTRHDPMAVTAAANIFAPYFSKKTDVNSTVAAMMSTDPGLTSNFFFGMLNYFGRSPDNHAVMLQHMEKSNPGLWAALSERFKGTPAPAGIGAPPAYVDPLAPEVPAGMQQALDKIAALEASLNRVLDGQSAGTVQQINGQIHQEMVNIVDEQLTLQINQDALNERQGKTLSKMIGSSVESDPQVRHFREQRAEALRTGDANSFSGKQIERNLGAAVRGAVQAAVADFVETFVGSNQQLLAQLTAQKAAPVLNPAQGVGYGYPGTNPRPGAPPAQQPTAPPVRGRAGNGSLARAFYAEEAAYRR